MMFLSPTFYSPAIRQVSLALAVLLTLLFALFWSSFARANTDAAVSLSSHQVEPGQPVRVTLLSAVHPSPPSMVSSSLPPKITSSPSPPSIESLPTDVQQRLADILDGYLAELESGAAGSSKNRRGRSAAVP